MPYLSPTRPCLVTVFAAAIVAAAPPAAADVTPFDSPLSIGSAVYADVDDTATPFTWMPGAVLAQAVTYVDATPGTPRFSTSGVRIQTPSNGAHGGAQLDVVSLSGLPDLLGGQGESGLFWIDATAGHADANDPNSAFQLDLQSSYADVAVFVQNRSFMHWHPVSITVDAVAADSATLYMDEPSAYDGGHASELLAYAAIAPGEYTLDDGRRLLVGKVDIDATADADDFHSLDLRGRFAGEPAVIVRSQGIGRVDYQGVRVRKVFAANGDLDAVEFRPDFEGADHGDSAGTFAYLALGDPAPDEVSLPHDVCWSADAGLIAQTSSFRLEVTDGRLLLSRQADGLWWPVYGSDGPNDADRVCFQGDGNIVGYDGAAVEFATRTHGQGFDTLVLSETCGLYLSGGGALHMLEDLRCAATLRTITADGYSFDLSDADIVEDGDSVTATGTVWLDMGDHTIELSDAALALTFDGSSWSVDGGDIDGIGGNLFQSIAFFESLAGSGLEFSVGFAAGAELTHAPVAEDDTFFYLELAIGASMQLGDVTLESAHGAEVRLYVDPTGPTVYVYGAGIFPSVGPVSIDEAGFGVSASDGLEWTPVTNWRNGSSITSRTGNVYLMGTISLGAGEYASVSLTADALLDADFDELLGANPAKAFDALAVNATLSASLDLMAFGVSFDLADASAVYEAAADGSFGSLAASGEMSVPQIPGFDLISFDAGAQAAFYTNGDTIRLDVDGRITLPGGIGADAFLHFDEHHGIIDASVDLGPSSFDVDGIIDHSGDFEVSASGSFSKANAGIARLSGSVTVTIDNNGVTTDVSAQGCVWAGSWHCDSVSADVQVSGGGVEVCARVGGKDLCANASF